MGGSDNQCSLTEVKEFLRETQTFMDSTQWVERYAWYGVKRDLNGVNEASPPPICKKWGISEVYTAEKRYDEPRWQYNLPRKTIYLTILEKLLTSHVLRLSSRAYFLHSWGPICGISC